MTPEAFSHHREVIRRDLRFRWAEEIPCLTDDGVNHPEEVPLYTLHAAWAARVLAETVPHMHVDFGGWLPFLAIASAICPITAYDVRELPLMVIGDFASSYANLQDLQRPDTMTLSVSCLHVLEHIGLGRYGDSIDPQGDIRAAGELARILALGGNLLIVLPLAKEARINFNAHRIYTYDLALSLFPTLKLKEFSLCLPPRLIRNADPVDSRVDGECAGCFWFTKEAA